MEINLTPGETLKVERTRRGMNIPAVAALLGCSTKYASMIERDMCPTVGLKIAFTIEREFGIPAESWIKVAA